MTQFEAIFQEKLKDALNEEYDKYTAYCIEKLRQHLNDRKNLIVHEIVSSVSVKVAHSELDPHCMNINIRYCDMGDKR